MTAQAVFFYTKNQSQEKKLMGNTQNQLPMKVDVKIGSIRPEGSIKAIASVNLNDCFAIRNVKVVDSSKGLFVAMPSYKAGNGEYKDICFPVTKEFREQLNQAVIGAYNQALAQSQNTAPHLATAPQQETSQPAMQMGGM